MPTWPGGPKHVSWAGKLTVSGGNEHTHDVLGQGATV